MTDHVRGSLSSGDAVAQMPGGTTEEEMVGKLENAKADHAIRQFFDHVHNLHGKTLDDLFDAYIGSIDNHLPEKYKGSLKGCRNFKDFAKMLGTTRSTTQQVILEAAQPFCKEYNIDEKFWVQWRAVKELNRGRNAGRHCGVGESAAFLSKACAAQDEFPDAQHAWGMIEALARYGSRNAAQLDAAAEAQRKEELAVTANVKQRHPQQRSGFSAM